MKSRTANIVMWSAIERFSVQGIQFMLTLVIARLVQPSDYGLIAMIGVFLALAQCFIDSGFSNALVQKQDRTEVDYSTVFYFNIVVGILVYLLLFWSSPYIASFYNVPQLEIITKIVGLNLIINSLAIVQRAKLIIALNFKTQAYASLIAVILSGVVGVWMAYKGYGVWALVVQTLSQNILNTMALWFFARWLPSFCFSWNSFHPLFRFGSKLLLSGLLHTIYKNLYSLVIGKKFAATELGYYNRAYSFTYVISGNLVEIIARAIYPIQCEVQNDEEKLRNSFLTYIRMSCFVVFPLMIGLFALAKPLIIVLLTEKWLPSVEILQILCLAYMWEVLTNLNYTILNVKGRTDYTLKSEILKKIIALCILLVTMQFGLKIMCWGLVLYAFFDLLIMTQFAKKIINVGFFLEVKTIFPIFVLSISMGGAIYWSSTLILNELIQLLVGLVVGLLYYLSMSYLFKFKEVKIIKDFIFKKL